MGSYILVAVPKEPRLSNKAVEKMSDLTLGLGNIMVGSIILPFAFDKGDVRFILLGSGAAILFWMISIWLANKLP